jgi:hypothetical protein
LASGLGAVENSCGTPKVRRLEDDFPIGNCLLGGPGWIGGSSRWSTVVRWLLDRGSHMPLTGKSTTCARA